ncbi:MAG: hypothetical protein JNJ89_09115 [Rubrivivax sp.]|nr:hypothetical protein [Rubrivivax sp.]
MKAVRDLLALSLICATSAALAKLPPPSEEAKAKAAEAAVKAAHAAKVEAFKLCKAMDKVAAGYHADAKKSGRETKAPVATPACADPGPFVAAPAAAKK